MNTTTINTIKTITATSCGVCGILFGLESDFMVNRQRDGRDFYCPNGHEISWKASNERQREVARLRDELRWANDDLEAARIVARAADYRARAAKGQLTKYRRRLEAGLCPVQSCRRTFSNLAAHIHTVHPDIEAKLDVD